MMLLTKKNRADLPKLYSNEDKPAGEHIAVVKFFDPTGFATWYATEFDGEDTFFGYADLFGRGTEGELGYFSLSELESVKGRFGLGIERDRYFTPTALKDLHLNI